MLRNLRGIYIIWYRDLLRFWHDKIRFLGSVTQPLLFLFVFGSGLGSRLGSLGAGVNFSQFIFPGIIGMNVFMSSFMAGVSVVWDREFGFLKEVLVAPISRISVVIGKTLGGASIALAQGAALLLLAPLVGTGLSIGKILTLIPLLFLLAMVTGSLGILLATRIRSMEAFQTMMQLLVFPMIFLAGIFFPIQGLPSWLNFLVKVNPATYGIAAVREVVLGRMADSSFTVILLGHTVSLWENILIMAVFGVITILIAMWSFSHQG